MTHIRSLALTGGSFRNGSPGGPIMSTLSSLRTHALESRVIYFIVIKSNL